MTLIIPIRLANEELLERGRMSMRVPRINVRYSGDEEVYEGPPRIFRSKTQKRSQSHPHNCTASHTSDEDCESDTCTHNCCDEFDRINFKRSCRCSLHSTCSSFASRSISTSSTSCENGNVLAEAIWDHVAVLADELPFAAGELINVLDCTSQSSLWYGSCRDNQGWFPASHVKVLCNSNGHKPNTENDFHSFPPAMRRYRANVVEELLHTEREYVRLLEDIVHGFLEQTKRRTEMFSSTLIKNVFGNIQSIYTTQCKLLRDLEMALDQQKPENSCIGPAFLRNKHAFAIYSDYCNNRPLSVSELSQLSRHTIYRQFFEACRLLRGMPNLSLEAFLLTPVQRICRYPLHLSELLKATPMTHDDYSTLQAAEKAMRSVASQINDRKRKIEALQEMIKWQRKVLHWKQFRKQQQQHIKLLGEARCSSQTDLVQGPDLVDNNSSLLRSGQLYCRCVVDSQPQWSKDVVLFLFDQAIVICKKDVLKKNGFVFKERMSLTTASIQDTPDGKDQSFGVNVKNAFKVVNGSRQYLFTCPDKKAKSTWLSAFSMRQSMSFAASAEEKRLAIATLNASHFI
ncbi:unnamed protein product [Caenorhabditis auriculariae]|uniref:Uncharacterized protein n=1 Tax=Caenorhabditis auriculariae TaxID=2777116 RepID=A0A8S1H3G9_9PELO|nr:unnamed protein product [Caenorhabditis auriculariae]